MVSCRSSDFVGWGFSERNGLVFQLNRRRFGNNFEALKGYSNRRRAPDRSKFAGKVG